MRISEKTIELNFCKGFPLVLGHDLFWFGLTQKQEAQAGFDACTKTGSTLLLFQLKASRHVLRNGSRRFVAEHDQMQTLRDQVRKNRHIYYVLPVVGTTSEICSGLCFSHCSRYLDISQLPKTIPHPLAKGANPPTVRKTNCHYIDMAATLATAIIHSDPFEVDLLDGNELANSVELSGQGIERPNTYHQERPTKEPSKTCIGSEEFEAFWKALRKTDRTGLFGAYVA